VGTLASQYETLRVIHDGGDQCRVIRVRSRDDGAVYVMKIVDKKLLRCQKEALFREMTMRLMNTLESEHIVQIHGCFEDSDNFYILQEACEGGNLVDLLRLLESVNQGMDVETLQDEVRQAVGELLLSLDHLHKKGLIHKDVKLENAVFKTKRSITTKNPNLSKYLKVPRVLKLIDFDYLLDWKRNKRSKDVLGTDGYIAPEAYLGYACPKSDIFSAGVVMFLLISGRFPFDDEIFDDCANQNYPGHPKMQEIYDKLEKFEVRYGKSWKHMDQAKDFCKTLLEFSVDKRPNAEEALKHPWMAKFVEEMKLPMVKEEVATNANIARQGSQETMKTLTRRKTIA
jgi:serine/threonine protein kinase